jgi:hypothetical protein
MYVTVSGCTVHSRPSPADGVVTVWADPHERRPGDRVIVQTYNRLPRMVYENECGGQVQGYELHHQWNGSYGFGRACASSDQDDRGRLSHVPIAPGATHIDTLFVSGGAYVGTWRVELELYERVGERFVRLPEAQRASKTFHVRGGWLLETSTNRP